MCGTSKKYGSLEFEIVSSMSDIAIIASIEQHNDNISGRRFVITKIPPEVSRERLIDLVIEAAFRGLSGYKDKRVTTPSEPDICDYIWRTRDGS